MTKYYSHSTDQQDYTCTGNVTLGGIHRAAERAGIYANTGTTGDVVPVAYTGTWNGITKATGVTFADGEKLYATTGSELTDATGANNLPIGFAVGAATSAAATAAVALHSF